MVRHATFVERVGYWPCVAPATILDDEVDQSYGRQVLSLREEASQDGLCYLRVIRHLEGTDLYQAHVAGSVDLLRSQPLTAFFTEEQLYLALPYDCRVQGKTSMAVCALLHAHAGEVRPLVQCEPVQNALVCQAEPVDLKRVLVDVEVTTDAVYEALASASKKGDPSPTMGTYRMQQALLRAVLTILTNTLAHVKNISRMVHLKKQQTLVKRLRRWHRQTHQRVVNAVSFYDPKRRQTIWSLTVGAPEELLNAA